MAWQRCTGAAAGGGRPGSDDAIARTSRRRCLVHAVGVVAVGVFVLVVDALAAGVDAPSADAWLLVMR